MQLLHAGLDIGSTTAKVVVLDEYDRIIFSRYSRHFADIRAAEESAERFEGLTRTLFLAAPLIHDEPDVTLAGIRRH